MYAVSFYDSDPDAGPEHFQRLVDTYPRHKAYLEEFAKNGEVLMIGTFGDPATQGSMAVFRSREAAERFRASDPFYDTCDRLEAIAGIPWCSATQKRR